MTKENLQKKIISANNDEDIKLIVSEIMATPIPWLFTKKFGVDANDKFREFKVFMASMFSIPPTDIFICGSSLLGFSLSPHKNFSDFSDSSDVDIVIINSKLFKQYWKAFFVEYTYSKLVGKNYAVIAKNVFKHFIDFHNQYASTHPLFIEWEKKTAGYKKVLQIKYDFPSEVSYRIYSSYEDYQSNLIKTIYDIKYPYAGKEN